MRKGDFKSKEKQLLQAQEDDHYKYVFGHVGCKCDTSLGQEDRNFSAITLPLVMKRVCGNARLGLGQFLNNLLDHIWISLFNLKFEFAEIISLESILTRYVSKVRDFAEF